MFALDSFPHKLECKIEHSGFSKFTEAEDWPDDFETTKLQDFRRYTSIICQAMKVNQACWEEVDAVRKTADFSPTQTNPFTPMDSSIMNVVLLFSTCYHWWRTACNVKKKKKKVSSLKNDISQEVNFIESWKLLTYAILSRWQW